MSNWPPMDVCLARPDPRLAPQLQDLARRALVPSGCNAPELVLPALAGQPRAVLATVQDAAGLRLALPLATGCLPFALHRNIATDISYFGLPHVAADAAAPAIGALLDHLRAPLLLHSVPVAGPLWTALAGAAARFSVLDRWERAVLAPRGTFAEWFDRNFDRKKRNQLRRHRNHLAALGPVETADLASRGDIGPAVRAFLDLEAAGWKGRRGTALGSDPRTAATFGEAMRRLHAAGKLRLWQIALDGRPAAMLFAVVERDCAWLGKIAYDESLARLSPGVQVILLATEAMFAEGITFADSCAIPDHPMINHIWRDRMAVADIVIAGPGVAAGNFALAVAAEQARRHLRAAARAAYHHVTGRRRR